MRRIPCPPRADHPALPLPLYVIQRVRPLARECAFAPCTQLRSTSATFSTSRSRSFLLPGSKPDKRKHQQFVRRWQKRLLGDSEPIGAHVDPYDPTSPVRIAPEEQGEYEEVLDEDGPNTESHVYEPAERSIGLLRVGGEQWLKQKLEGEMAKEFEKLTLRTYTPLSLGMANEIEELTGTPYTLRDENLMMAQTTHDTTAQPYTNYNFGLNRKITSPSELSTQFRQALCEIYTLERAGLDMDMSKFTNRGIYNPPRWMKDIKLTIANDGALVLAFPKHKSAAQLLQVMQAAPAWEAVPAQEEERFAEDALDLPEPVVSRDTSNIMDPDTPNFKRTAVVKLDGEKKPFDFMSNRPVPRTESIVDPTFEDMEETRKAAEIITTPATTILAELALAAETSQSIISELRHSFFEHRSRQLADNVLSSGRFDQQDKVDQPVILSDDVKWRQVCLGKESLKFALFKRLLQLTRIRIPDPQLSFTDTLGELYNHLCEAARPQPRSLFSAIHLDGQRARERAKQQDGMSKRRADLGDLINLGNVELRRVKPTKTEERTRIGLDKVIQYALWERGLGRGKPPRVTHARTKKAPVFEGTREVPEFGKPLSSAAARFLSKKTMRLRHQQEMQA